MYGPSRIAWALLSGGLVYAACAHPRPTPSNAQLGGAASLRPAVAAQVPALPAHAPAQVVAAPQAAPPKVDFTTRVQPILAHCQPCHFPGGKMYAALPFDRAATVLLLREKLFTRIKDERERGTIREFLAQNPAPP